MAAIVRWCALFGKQAEAISCLRHVEIQAYSHSGAQA
jgi:hypothetical protein